MSEPLRLQVKVIPGAVKEGVEWYGDALKVKVRAPPEKGKANTAVLALLAQRLGMPASRLEIIAGHHSPMKTVAIDGVSDLQKLRALLP